MNPDIYLELVKQISTLQRQVDGLVKPEVGRWVDWTPTITQNVGVAVTISYARYIINGPVVLINTYITANGAGIGGNTIIAGGIPIPPAQTAFGNASFGIAEIADVGTTNYIGSVGWQTASSVRFIPYNGTTIGANPNFALAVGDIISFTAIYEW